MDKFIDNLKKGFNIAVNEAEKLTKVVAGKTSNIVDVTKVNLSLGEIDRKITREYAKIGELIFKKHQAGTEFDGELGTICAEIESLTEEAEKLKEELASLKNSSVCSSCGHVNDKSGDYCSKCGEKLASETIKQEDDMVIEVTEFPED